MRILSLSNSPLDPTLGSGKTVLRWTEGLRAHGHECCVLGGDDLLSPRWRSLPGRRFLLALNAWRVLRGVLKTFRPHLVEFYGAEFGLATVAVRQRSRRPLLVAHTNGLELLATAILPHPPRTTDFLHRKLDRAAFAYADRFVAICDADRDHLIRERLLPREQTAVVEPGLDPEFLAALSASDGPRDHAVAFTGSWVHRKDPESIAAVMDPLLHADPRLSFRVFGAPGAEPAVRASFSPAVQARIEIAGKLSNAELAAQLARCKVFFFPSRYEGYGIALAEAMACGCAAVTTPTGLGASLRDRSEARICRVGERGAMSAAIRELLENDAQRSAIAHAARSRVAGLTWPAQVARLHEFYSSWVAGQT